MNWRLSREKKRWLMGVTAVVLLAFGFLLEERVRGHLALKSWERSQHARGERLTVAELMPVRTNQGLRILSPAQFQSRTVASAGEDPPVDRQAIAPGTEVVLWRVAEWRVRSGRTNTWAAEAAWFQPTRELLEAFGADLEAHPTVVQPAYEQGLDMLQPHLTGLKNTVQSLRRDALLALHEGRLEDVVRDLRTTAALVEMQRDEAVIICQLVRVAVAEIGLGGMLWQALQAGGWSDEQLAAIQEAWERARFLPAMIQAIAMERAMAADYFQGKRGNLRDLAESMGWPGATGRDSNPAGSLGRFGEWLGPVLEQGQRARRLALLGVWRAGWVEQDLLFYNEAVQRTIEAARAAEASRSVARLRSPAPAGPEGKFRLAVPQPFDADTMGGWARFQHWLSLTLLGIHDRLLEKAAQMECRREMSLAAVALERYRLRHGEWPAELAALTPEFLEQVPWDWMSGEPLRYRRNHDGSYLLYSVGLDGQDDGGDPTPPSERSRAWFNGRDWVWPRPASAAEVEAALGMQAGNRRAVPRAN